MVEERVYDEGIDYLNSTRNSQSSFVPSAHAHLLYVHPV